ncbi:MltA domain-containing protein [Colwellia sp. 1_MG-2023]|uniref:MltA domain-containing protein n=1 Tax=Colwellia sp. 1_MG-2023 TaxID=3062649 RepID=UPI0026E306AC|nr:MltA domain-containing protein [Colwellia sp. 1_MG-2023]MDO6445470.1 MltA domain-containing protein [Colwellia sp. 1_MG-2023]
MMNIYRPISLVFISLSFSIHAEFVLQKSPEIDGEISVNTANLCDVADNTKRYIELFPQDTFAVHSGEVIEGVSLTRVVKTLDFLCQSPENRSFTREYLLQHFDFYRWLPDKKQAHQLAEQSKNAVKKRLLNNIPEQQIFITKYYTKLLNASEKPTAQFNQALYALPADEQGMSLVEAEKNKQALTRYQLTRQQIINGALLDNNLAQPLIWLTEEALHDVLLQGTGVVEINGKRRYFNVHRNNGIAYDYTRGKREQARYWYFAEVPSILGYGKTLADKISIKPDVTFAGNVKQLGLGKLFLINYQVDGKPVNNMGVLADQGGAFDNNLFQLDFLKGSYYGWKDYYQANKHLPDYANTWLMLKKQ